MRKILVTASAAIIGAIAITASAAPASAGNFNFTLGLGGYGYGPGWGPGWGPYYGGGVYVGNPYPGNNWQAHVQWCYDHKGPSYNPNTNKYINQYGHKKYCHSPFA